MTNEASEILLSLAQRGVHVFSEHGKIRCRAPKGGLLPQEVSFLRSHKIEILNLLEARKLDTDLPLQPRPPGSIVPLTPIQAKVWRLLNAQGMQPEPRYFMVGIRIFGPLDILVLERSIEDLVARHESLRTTIIVVDDAPRQHVAREFNRKLSVIDISQVPRDAAEGQLNILATEFAEQKICLSIGPLFEAKLIKVSHIEYVLLLAVDHMITDGISNAILERDLWMLYRFHSGGTGFSLPRLPIQLPDYAVWQERTYNAWLGRKWPYLHKCLNDAPRLRLPVDESVLKYQAVGEVLGIEFGNQLSEQLHKIARQERTLVALVVLSLYISVMSCLCNQRRMAVTFVESGRHCQDLQDVVGWLANHLIFCIEIDSKDSFLDLLKRVTQEYCDAYDRQSCNRVLLLLNNDSFDLYFNYLSTWRSVKGVANCGDLKTEPFLVRRRNPPFKFGAFFRENIAEIGGAVVYRADLLKQDTVEKFLHHMRCFSEFVVESPIARISSVQMDFV